MCNRTARWRSERIEIGGMSSVRRAIRGKAKSSGRSSISERRTCLTAPQATFGLSGKKRLAIGRRTPILRRSSACIPQGANDPRDPCSRLDEERTARRHADVVGRRLERPGAGKRGRLSDAGGTLGHGFRSKDRAKFSHDLIRSRPGEFIRRSRWRGAGRGPVQLSQIEKVALVDRSRTEQADARFARLRQTKSKPSEYEIQQKEVRAGNERVNALRLARDGAERAAVADAPKGKIAEQNRFGRRTLIDEPETAVAPVLGRPAAAGITIHLRQSESET